MNDALSHRGPNGEGTYFNAGIGLGHRRLAILDLSPAGNQPMISRDGRYILIYNGEVYNFKDIRIELEQKGYQFHSHTDSEVVLHSYTQWGPECVNKFNGMFAFAIWDQIEKTLFIARDRYGIKPLYYSFHNNIFIFSSEQKAILTHPDMQRTIDFEAVFEYFTFQNILTDRTFFQDIKLFPAGCWAKLDLNTPSQSLKPIRYWDFCFQEPTHKKNDNEYIEELDRLFRQAVKRQLVSDVPVGSYLSGGIDSGSIAALAAQQLPYITTFTCGFDLHSISGLEIGFDERDKAEYMSYLFKTEHYEMVLKAGDMERVFSKLVWHLEEPRVGQSYPNYYIAQLASKFVRVVLSGTGGDEIFGGYPWRYYRAVVNTDFDHYIDKYFSYWQRLVNNDTLEKLFRPINGPVSRFQSKEVFRSVFKNETAGIKSPEDYLNHSLYFEAKTFLHGLLIVEDKLSMAHGLETRVPFLDNDLVDFGMKIPAHLKLKNLRKMARADENEIKRYYQNNRDGKIILRKLMKKYLPEKITKGSKKGFSAPDASWFKGESIDYVKNKLFSNNAKIYQYMDKSVVQELVSEHLSGKINRRLFIWSLLNFEWWLNLYLENSDVSIH